MTDASEEAKIREERMAFEKAKALHKSIEAIRAWQRHWLLRNYGDDGHVLPENIDLSEHIDDVLAAVNSYDPAREAKVRALVKAAEEAASLCRCRGKGVYTKSCSMCGDSTFDHVCDDDDVPCTDQRCIALRAALAPFRDAERKVEG